MGSWALIFSYADTMSLPWQLHMDTGFIMLLDMKGAKGSVLFKVYFLLTY